MSFSDYVHGLRRLPELLQRISFGRRSLAEELQQVCARAGSAGGRLAAGSGGCWDAGVQAWRRRFCWATLRLYMLLSAEHSFLFTQLIPWARRIPRMQASLRGALRKSFGFWNLLLLGLGLVIGNGIYNPRMLYLLAG